MSMSTVSVSKILFIFSVVSCDAIHVSVFGGFQSTVMRDVEVATVVGGAVSLECDFVASKPSPQVTWFADDVIAQEMPSPNTVLFANGGRYLFLGQLTTAQRMMRYHCSVSNPLYPNPMPMRAPTTYILTGDLPRDNSVNVYKELGSMVGSVGEPLEFIYAAAARRTDGSSIPLGITCPTRDPFVALPATATMPIVTTTLKDTARNRNQVNFTCQLASLGPGISRNVTGIITVSSEC